VHHEAQVGADHLLAGFLVALLDPFGELCLFCGAEKRETAEIVEEQPHQVGPCGTWFAHDSTPLGSGQFRGVGVFDPVLG
jgi:predicted cobalt transporter CbtA